jgi:hypothetical protein
MPLAHFTDIFGKEPAPRSAARRRIGGACASIAPRSRDWDLGPAEPWLQYRRGPGACCCSPHSKSIVISSHRRRCSGRSLSAREGHLGTIAQVNFLEHHIEKVREAVGLGLIYPVTADHEANSSCDAARCELCFVRPESTIRYEGRHRVWPSVPNLAGREAEVAGPDAQWH